MVAPNIARRARWVPPVTAQVDNGNPLTAGLRAVWWPEVRGRAVTTWPALGNGIGACGPTKTGNTASNCTRSIATGMSVFGGVTITGVAHVTSATTGGWIALNALGDNGIAVGIGDTTFDGSGSNIIILYGGVAWRNTGVAWPTGTSCFVAVHPGNSGTGYMYVNGVQLGSWTASTPSSTPLNMVIGAARSDGGRPMTSAVGLSFAAVHDRALSQSEAQRLSLDPFQMLRW